MFLDGQPINTVFLWITVYTANEVASKWVIYSAWTNLHCCCACSLRNVSAHFASAGIESVYLQHSSAFAFISFGAGFSPLLAAPLSSEIAAATTDHMELSASNLRIKITTKRLLLCSRWECSTSCAHKRICVVASSDQGNVPVCVRIRRTRSLCERIRE